MPKSNKQMKARFGGIYSALQSHIQSTFTRLTDVESKCESDSSGHINNSSSTNHSTNFLSSQDSRQVWPKIPSNLMFLALMVLILCAGYSELTNFSIITKCMRNNAIIIASFYMDGLALNWFPWMFNNYQISSWITCYNPYT